MIDTLLQNVFNKQSIGLTVWGECVSECNEQRFRKRLPSAIAAVDDPEGSALAVQVPHDISRLESEPIRRVRAGDPSAWKGSSKSFPLNSTDAQMEYGGDLVGRKRCMPRDIRKRNRFWVRLQNPGTSACSLREVQGL